jgi:hypothetical protein
MAALAIMFMAASADAQSFTGAVNMYLDAATDTIYVWGDTTVTGGADYYYTTAFWVDLWEEQEDGSWYPVAGAYNAGDYLTEIEFSYSPAIGGRQYYADGIHEMTARYTGQELIPECDMDPFLSGCSAWYDPFGFSLLSTQEYPEGYFTEYPPYQEAYPEEETTHMAETTPQVTYSPCGNAELDRLYGEYRNTAYGASGKPACSEFETIPSTTHFSQANFKQGNPDYSWGLYTAALKTGAECVYEANGGTAITMTSVFRNPKRNSSIPGAALNSYHIYGRGVDFAAAPGSNLALRARDVIKPACSNPCVEPDTDGWVHFEWRPSGAACPVGW